MFGKVRIHFCLVMIALVMAGCANGKQAIPEPADAGVKTEEEMVVKEIEARVAVEPGSTLAIRKSPGTKGKPDNDVLERVPAGRILKIKNKYENSIIEDEYIWWEVEDTIAGISGWVAANFLSINEE